MIVVFGKVGNLNAGTHSTYPDDFAQCNEQQRIIRCMYPACQPVDK